MDEFKQRLEDIKVVLISKKRERQELKEFLSKERLKDSPDKVKLSKIESSMKRLTNEIENELPGLQKEIESKIRKKIEEEKAKPQLIAEQKRIIKKLKKDSTELLNLLRQAEKINSRLINQSAKYRQLQKRTNTEIDMSNCSGGFTSLRVIKEVLESEVGGFGRRLVFWPRQARL